MSRVIKIPGRLESAETGNVVAGADAIMDDVRGKKQVVINNEVDAAILGIAESKQDKLTFDSTPTSESTNPVTSGGVYAADQLLSQAIEAILLLIPSAASALNQLADKSFVNSSIATDTATFRGTYNLVSDLHLGVSATHAQIAAALDALSLTADNNDYAFVQVPNTDTAPTEIAKTERYKFNGTSWAYEYDLNNSGFTADQWASINSGITQLLVSKLGALPTNSELVAAFAAKQDTLTFDNVPVSGSNNPVKSGGVFSRNTEIVAMITALDAAKQNVLTFDNTPTQNSTNPVTSNGVYVAIAAVQAAVVALDAAKQNVLTFDNTPTLGSSNPVTSSGIKTELNRIDGNITTLDNLYQALTQSALVVVQPTDTWPVANPNTTTIYRVVDRVNTPPQYYSDYMWNGTSMVQMAQYDNAIDDVPTENSNNLVKSGGVFIEQRKTNALLYCFFQTNITYSISDTTIILTIPCVAPSSYSYGYFKYQDGTEQQIFGRTTGTWVAEVPRTHSIVVNPKTGQGWIYDNSTPLGDLVVLFRNVIGTVEGARGPLAEYINNLRLKSIQQDIQANANKIDLLDAIEHFAFQTNILFAENNDASITLKIPTLSSTSSIFGYYRLDRNGNAVNVSCATVGDNIYTIPRLSRLALNMTTKEVLVTDSNYNSNYVTLLFNWGGSIITCYGPLADYLNKTNIYDKLSEGKLPSYYGQYMDNRIKTVNNKEFDSDINMDTFVFVTDTHDINNERKSPLMIAEILKKTTCDKVIWGGDAIWAYSPETTDTPAICKDEIIKEWELHHSNFSKAILPYGKLYNCRGNHDFTIKIKGESGSGIGTGYTFGQNAAFNNIVPKTLDFYNVNFNKDDVSCYYFFDCPKSKTRYVVCDGCSLPAQTGNYGWGLQSGISATQMAWIKQNAFLGIPAGFSLVIINHEGIVYETNPNGYSAFSNLLTEVNSLAARTGDYSETDIPNIVVICGHWHEDAQTYINGVLHIATSCDYRDVFKGMLVTPTVRDKGTVNEQLFDLFLSDFGNNKIQSVRFGCGNDRLFNLNKIELNVGQTYTLTPNIAPVTYGSYDSDGNIWSASEGWTLVNTKVSNNNGVVTALQTGEAVAYVIDSEGNKEFWNIVVS